MYPVLPARNDGQFLEQSVYHEQAFSEQLEIFQDDFNTLA